MANKIQKTTGYESTLLKSPMQADSKRIGK